MAVGEAAFNNALVEFKERASDMVAPFESSAVTARDPSFDFQQGDQLTTVVFTDGTKTIVPNTTPILRAPLAATDIRRRQPPPPLHNRSGTDSMMLPAIVWLEAKASSPPLITLN